MHVDRAFMLMALIGLACGGCDRREATDQEDVPQDTSSPTSQERADAPAPSVISPPAPDPPTDATYTLHVGERHLTLAGGEDAALVDLLPTLIVLDATDTPRRITFETPRLVAADENRWAVRAEAAVEGARYEWWVRGGIAPYEIFTELVEHPADPTQARGPAVTLRLDVRGEALGLRESQGEWARIGRRGVRPTAARFERDDWHVTVRTLDVRVFALNERAMEVALRPRRCAGAEDLRTWRQRWRVGQRTLPRVETLNDPNPCMHTASVETLQTGQLILAHSGGEAARRFRVTLPEASSSLYVDGARGVLEESSASATTTLKLAPKARRVLDVRTSAGDPLYAPYPIDLTLRVPPIDRDD